MPRRTSRLITPRHRPGRSCSKPAARSASRPADTRLDWYRRRGLLFFEWWGTAESDFDYRSWTLPLEPHGRATTQRARSCRHAIKLDFRIIHHPPIRTFDYTVKIWTPATVLLASAEENLAYDKLFPWDTYFHSVPPSLATARCRFRAKA